jgi:hypothetical protein
MASQVLGTAKTLKAPCTVDIPFLVYILFLVCGSFTNTGEFLAKFKDYPRTF